MDEFAPLYSTRERIILAIKAVLICVPLYVIGDYWFVPWLGDYAKDAHCQQYGSLNGVELLMYGIFCGIPLSTALLLWFALGRRAARAWKLGQDPLPGEKVLRPTRYRYGKDVRLRSLLAFGFILFFIGMAIWGSFQAADLTREIPPCH